MNLLPFDALAAHRPRRFVPQQIDLGDWAQIEPLFDQLENRAPLCKAAAELERWLLDWSELNAALDEESSRRYIAMTCHTDSAEAEKAYLHFVENIDPKLKPRQFKLAQVYVAHPTRAQLPKERYGVFDRDTKVQVELFRPENVPLETEEARLSQQYQKLSGSLTVQFRGEEKTLVQMGRYLEETDRALRHTAWELVAKRRLQEADKFEDIFDQLVKLREQIAKNAGFDNYRDYAFRRLGRFDYEPADCMKFHDAVEAEIMPVVRELQGERRRKMGLGKDQQKRGNGPLSPTLSPSEGEREMDAPRRDQLERADGPLSPTLSPSEGERESDTPSRADEPLSPTQSEQHKIPTPQGLSPSEGERGTLRPWDLAVDPASRPPLRPFEQVDEMVSRTQKIFDRLDGELAEGFRRMQNLKLLDLANRKGKAPGGYQSTLAEARVPFIFMNAIGLQRDVETILHEAGHAFHALATRKEEFYPYRSAPIEFCEVASMSMELLGNEFLEQFYSVADANRARQTHLEGIMNIFPWIATVDAFQHWIYTHPGHSRAERTAAWLQLMDRFGGDVDWSGHEAARANLWHRQLHIFIHAFYYIEYGIAQLGALQVWANSKRNKAGALNDYKGALELGGSRPLPELFAAAGCRFEFDRKTIAPLMRMVRSELGKMKVTTDEHG